MSSPPNPTLEAVRQQAILASLAGFPFLLVFGLTWILTGILSYLVQPGVAPLIYMFQGVPAAPVAIALERKLGYVRVAKPDPLLPLTLQILFVQVVAFPAVFLVWSMAPAYTPVAMAAIVGGHFLPFQWVYRTSLYGVLGVLVAVGAYAIAVIFREGALHYTGFFVGGVLLVGAFIARSYASATWIASQRGGR